MSLYMYLVVVAVLVLPTDSVKCVFPDELQYDVKEYGKNDYYSISLSPVRNMVAYTKYSYDENNKTKIREQIVEDYNVKMQFHNDPNVRCIRRKITKYTVGGIPDNAVRLVQFPVPWPYKVPDKTEYWSFKMKDNTKIIVAVGRIQPKVCIPRAVAIFTRGKKKFPKTTAFAIGNYSLIISDKKVFEVPSECLQRMDRARNEYLF